MSEEARNSRQEPKGWPSGPRSLLLRRDHGGFGFTLRHFIVYPPESYTVLAGDRRLGLRPGALDEPMDTIFVRSVKPGGAADRAGLRTGDRVVSVNGENIGGHSYASVVHRIHNSGPTLHLLVVPQQLDILQLYFNETAHRPESNLDLEPTMVRAGGVSARHNGAWDTGAQRVPATDHANSAGCRLSLDAGLMCRRDSSSQEGSVGDLSSDDSVIISRIRRSCEQKREFLAAPAWPQEPPAAAPASGIKEFYGRPQKLQPPPHWPPNIPGSPNHSPSRKEREDTPPRERGFVCGGPVTNAPCDRRQRAGFVNTLTRIQETTPPALASPQSPPLQFQVVSQRARQFESGSVPDRTSLYRSELARLSNKRMVPDVTVRAREFESKTDRQRESRSLDSAVRFLCRVLRKKMKADWLWTSKNEKSQKKDIRSYSLVTGDRVGMNTDQSSSTLSLNLDHRKHNKKKGKDTLSLDIQINGSERESEIKNSSSKEDKNKCEEKRENQSDQNYKAENKRHNSEKRLKDADSTSSNMPPNALSGNRLVPVGGRKLHCEPPNLADTQHLSYDENLRPRSSSAEAAWLEESWPQRHRAVRQDSYLAACHKPALPPAEAPNGLTKSIMEEETAGSPPPVPPHGIPKIRVEPATPGQRPEAVVPPSRPVRPTTLDLPPSPHPFPPTLRPHKADGTADAEGSGTEEDSNASLGSPVVVWRDKALSDAGSEEDRATRRVSYLKATWPDRMNVDSDPEASDTEPPISGEPRVSLCEDLSLPDKENLLVSREGLLHCKLTLIDGKRATDRSWKQVWAVLRGPVLYLYKERRDSLPQTETPAGAEAEQVDVRCALVGAADNYTKRKHVLRVNTLSGSELLLQAADAAQMARWIVSLEEQANNNNTQNASGPSISPASAQKGLRKLTSLRNRSPTGQSPVNKTRKPSQQAVEPVSSPKSKTWKGRVAKQLRRIQHSGSPTAPHPPSPSTPAYPEGATIGIPLEDCPPSATNEFVPLIVELCTNIVEERGLDIIGIYRVPGNTAAVSSLTEAVNRGLDAALLDQDQRWSDVNVISSLLKSFFRRLPDSLLTTELYPSFIQADKIADPHLRMATIRKLVHELPDYHYETLKYLLLHLRKVVDHSATNKMEARNLAIVFGPTLVRAADDNMVTMVTDMSHQCRIVETLILHVDWCFGDDSVLPEFEGEAGVEPDPAVANHNLLLGNIHKVEGMTRELSARDIVSSIICAANRKMMKSKTRKSHHQAQPQVPTTTQTGEDTTNDNKQGEKSKGGQEQQQHRKERLASTASEDSGGTSGSHQSAPAAPPPSSQADKVAETDGQTKTARPQAEAGTIRTYAGLSATTQERIRRFELETKAMLHRDAARLRRLEAEREQSKRELETDDHSNTPAIVKKIAECGRSGAKPLAVVSPCNGGEGGGLLRRGSSAENIHRAGLATEHSGAPTTAATDSGNLKRFKSAKDQGESGLARCGSLDSVHDLTPAERPPSHVSDEGDLLVSLTSTFDAKLRSLLSSGASEKTNAPSPSPLFTDPSLHKATDKEGKEEEAKEECCEKNEKSDKQTKPSKEESTKENEEENKENTVHNETPRVVQLYRSESVNKDERNSLTKSDSFKLRRSESLNKDSNSKLKRSDSLTKNEKTESNLNKRRQLEAGRWNNAVKLKRKTGSAIDRSIKRRHTVGGTKDFDKVHWLDNRQREAEEEEGKKERRTSSPDLSSSRLSAVVLLRPHSFAEPNLTERLCGVPLESHV